MNRSGSEKVLVVIPARGGSKGIIKKNLCRVGGHPLVGRAIMAAKGANLANAIVVSTDDTEIAAVSQSYGAEVIMRPKEISGDNASSESALLHAATERERNGNRTDIVVLQQCTAPFTTASDIDGTISCLLDGKADAAFAATVFQHFVWQPDNSGAASGINHDGGHRILRQNLQLQYLETGSVYAMRLEKLRQIGHRFCGRTLLYQIEASRCFEIDTIQELRHAQLIAHELDAICRKDRLPRQIEALVFNFDGVLTDDTLMVDENGVEATQCSRADDIGAGMLRSAGISMLVLSNEQHSVYKARCRKLGLPYRHGSPDKLAALKGWLKEHSIQPSRTLFVGSDIDDRCCLEYAGCAIGPADSHPDILGSLHILLNSRGGKGVLRELASLIVGNRFET